MSYLTLDLEMVVDSFMEHRSHTAQALKTTLTLAEDAEWLCNLLIRRDIHCMSTKEIKDAIAARFDAGSFMALTANHALFPTNYVKAVAKTKAS